MALAPMHLVPVDVLVKALDKVDNRTTQVPVSTMMGRVVNGLLMQVLTAAWQGREGI
jgi:hypothetical protein